jgi:hypothetical protein
MAAETIKEFLVSLGWKVDESSQRRFMSAVTGAIEPVAKLTSTATGAVAAIETMVATTAKSMNDLYYSAQRTGVAAQSLSNLGYAAQQVGMSFKDGTDLASAFSNAFQINPGNVELFKQLGGSVQYLNGVLGPTDKGMESVVRRLASMPRYEAIQFLSQFGISAQQAANILNNPEGFIAAMHQARDIAEALGSPVDDATKKGQSFSREWARFGDILSTTWDNVFNKIEPASESLLHVLDDNLLEFGKWSHELNDTPAIVTTVVAAIAGSLGTFGAISGAVGAAAKGTSILGGALRGLVGGFTSVFTAGTSFLGMMARIASNPVFAFLSTLLYSTDTQTGIDGTTHETQAGKDYADKNSVESPHHFGWGDITTQGTWNWIRRKMGMKPTSPTAGETGAAPTALSPTGNTDYLRIFQALEGSRADQTSSKGAVGRNQLMPATAKAIAKKYGMAYSDSMLFDPAYNDKIATLLQSELAGRYHGDLDAMAVDYNAGPNAEKLWAASGRNDAVLPAETQKYLGHLHNLEASGAITQTNNTTINVNGTANASDTARHVQDAQQSVNANNARNLSSGVR